MGNCLRSDKALAQNEPHRAVKEIKGIKTFTPSTLETKMHFDEDKSKKMVRLRIRGEGNVQKESDVDVQPKGGVLRIKVMVTQEELKQILNYKKNLKYPSVEQFVTAMKLRGRRIHETNDTAINRNWRPALESIPEDH